MLAFTGGNVSEAARVAEIDRRQVQRWLARLGVKG
ncbi:MAG: helix-turn-helix domain-containing protein [Deltaproteobacteria bacterium]|nr:helix-turn-helix domain-containing protein [Deltaproteobacteria bacterium]